MTQPLQYEVADGDTPRRARDLDVRLRELDLRPSRAAHLRIVHANSDALTQTARDAFLAGGGLYVEYTGASVRWQALGERYYFGNFQELLRRLDRLAPPVALEQLRAVLEEQRAFPDCLSALALLCQGYLAVSAAGLRAPAPELAAALDLIGWPPVNAAGQPAPDDNLAGRLTLVCSPLWWSSPFQGAIIGRLLDAIVQEWQEARHGCLPDALRSLIGRVEEGSAVQPAAVVADAYVALARRLGSPR
jgi:hypothetical protein